MKNKQITKAAGPSMARLQPQIARKENVGISLWIALLTFASAGLAADQATYIPARDLGPTLVSAITGAKGSVTAWYYLVALYPGRDSSQTMRIARALCAAAQRGVSVTVVLDKGAYLHGDPVEALQEDNRGAYEFLRSCGVVVFFSGGPSALHAKAMVVDSETVIVGSANISESALAENIEASVLVKSKEVAKKMLGELGAVPVKRRDDADTAAAFVPDAFLTDTTLLGRMIGRADERAFDAYMYLWKEAHGAAPDGANKQIVLDYGRMAAGLGLDSLAPPDFRRQINKTLEKLEKEYGLIKVALHFGKDAEVTLKPLGGLPVAIPASYWLYGWQKRLGFPAKVMALLSMRYSALSQKRPSWSVAASTLSRRHGMSIWFITTGTVALRRANLLDVEYSELPQDPDSTRKPNTYTPLPFDDPVQLAAKWLALETLYGKDMVGRGRACAELVYKDSDWRAVEQFILLERKYGREKVEKAFAIIKQKNPDNPHRCVGYFIKTIMQIQ